jgi:predicted DCC family thiol-disulfide oxidoreductase YuxK
MIAYQDAPSPPMTPELYEQCQYAMHVVLPDGRVLRGGRASLLILHIIGYRTTAKVLGYWPLSWCIDVGYKLVARNRHVLARWFANCS